MGELERSLQKPEIDFTSGDAPLPPNVRPVIVLSDSDYDMAYHYYQQLIQIESQCVYQYQYYAITPDGNS